jgi:hypothetical protein
MFESFANPDLTLGPTQRWALDHGQVSYLRASHVNFRISHFTLPLLIATRPRNAQQIVCSGQGGHC